MENAVGQSPLKSGGTFVGSGDRAACAGGDVGLVVGADASGRGVGRDGPAGPGGEAVLEIGRDLGGADHEALEEMLDGIDEEEMPRGTRRAWGGRCIS